jgi:hypothetical protein
MLNSRYDDLKRGRAKPSSGDEVAAHSVKRAQLGWEKADRS